MAILLFSRSLAFNYHEWLSDLEEELVVFTQVDLLDEKNFDHVVQSDSLDRDALVEIQAVELHRHYNFRAVIPHSEYDLIRAARLREYFGLEGQNVESATAFRDKVIMKRMVSKAGLPVTEFERVGSPLDLYRFAERNGYPLVIKPVDGGGSRNTQVVNSEEELKDYLRAGFSSNLMVEKFVEGNMYHVDGLLHKGEMLFSCASRYLNSCLAFNEGQCSGSILLDPKGDMSERLISEVQKVLGALPDAPTIAYHAEFFLTQDNRLLLCEIASRTAGGRVIDNIRAAFNVDLNRQWTRLLANIEEPIIPKYGQGLAGSLIFPPRSGVLKSLPATIPFEWVVDYTPVAKSGQKLTDAVSSMDNIASFVVKGQTEEEVEAHLRQLSDWFSEQLQFEENVQGEESLVEH